MRNNKKIVRLTEADLARLVKRVMNEGVQMGFDITPEDFIKRSKDGQTGSWMVKNGSLYLYHSMDPNKSQGFNELTCSPKNPHPSLSSSSPSGAAPSGNPSGAAPTPR